MIDTVLIDTSVIGHLIYHSWYGQQDLKEFVHKCVEAYEQIPFYLPECKSLIWVGDSKPYFRKLITRSYKGNRPEKDATIEELMSILEEKVYPLKYPHFEADDVIANYVKEKPQENIMILSVDSDLLQLIREPIYETSEGHAFCFRVSCLPYKETLVQGEVIWVCAHGHEPQIRRLPDLSFQTWFENKLCASKKKLSHLDLNNPRSIVDWKVIMGDTSDTILAGEQNRWMIDLFNPPANWRLLDQYPEFLQDVEKHRKLVRPRTFKTIVYDQFRVETNSNLPTAKTWEKPRKEKQWKKLHS